MNIVCNVFDVIYDNSSGGILSLRNINDGDSMNWVEGNSVWGTIKGAEFVSCKIKNDKTVAVFANKKLDIRVERSVSEDKLTERYVFNNACDFPVFIRKGEIGIYTTFNDSYDGADICMTQRCNTHIWCGGNTSWVNALKMGVSDINLGLVLTKGSIDCYSVEREWEKQSNDRGDFVLHPGAFTLEKGECYTIEWELFFHTGTEDFFGKLKEHDLIIPTAKHYTVFEEEMIEISVSKPVKVMLDGEALAENTDKLSFLPFRTGEHNFILKHEEQQTNIRIFVAEAIEKLVEKRVNYIVDNQQYHREDSPIDGAYLVYDTKEKMQYFDNSFFDHNASRERMGMGLLIAEYLKINNNEKIKESFEKYKKFFFEHIIDSESGEVFNSINRDNSYYRLYNYSWAIMFLVDLYYLEKNTEYLEIMVKAIKRYYCDGGSKFYPNGWFLAETVSALRECGDETTAEDILNLYREHVMNMVKIGTSYPPHEVNYEQTIVTPGATMITQYMLATGTEEFLADAKKQIDVLARFNGNQPDYHLYETAIRHWDGFWFGKYMMYGDTFPHYWSSLTGLSYLNYYKLTKEEEYLKKAEENVRNCLCLFDTLGAASCAYLYPYKINGKKGEFFDEWANDQDFALYYYLKYFTHN